jgi:regulator of protease activity HflC (stomatin/prohibitin superfamily)
VPFRNVGGDCRSQGVPDRQAARIIIPGVQRAFKVDLRVVTMDVPPQDVISRDNVTVRLNAVLYFRVVEPEKAIIQVEDYMNALNQLAKTTLRSASTNLTKCWPSGTK